MKNENSIYKRVKKLLIENPELRDSDRKVICPRYGNRKPLGYGLRKGF